MFPHTVTMYNLSLREDPESFEPDLRANITLLRGVLLCATKAASSRDRGLEGADSVTLYIPLDVDARDALTGEKKTFAEPLEYERAPDKSRLWTLGLDSGKGPDSFFVKGEVVVPGASFSQLSRELGEVCNITKAEKMDYGGLPHWEVGSRWRVIWRN